MRQSTGISLRQFAREVEVSPTYVSLVETGKERPPTPQRIARMAEVLNVPAEQLLAMAETPSIELLDAVRQIPEAAQFVQVAARRGFAGREFKELQHALEDGRLGALVERGRSAKEADRSRQANDRALGPHIDPALVFARTRAPDAEALFEFAARAIARRHPNIAAERLLEELRRCEQKTTSGIGGGVAIPHACLPETDKHIVLVARSSNGIDFAAVDAERVFAVFLLVIPGHATRPVLLARIARICKEPDFLPAFRDAQDRESLLALLRETDAAVS